MKTKEDIFRMIDEEDIEFIRLQFTDIMGNLKNIAITPGQLDRAMNNMYFFDAAALLDNVYDYQEDLYLRPDLDTFVILPWRPQQGKVAKVVCDSYTVDGEPFVLSSRKILKKVTEEAAKKGYSFLVDPECEFFLFNTNENGLPTTISHEQAGYMDVGPVDFGENARRDIVLMLEEMGFEIESSHHEHAPAQHEVDFSELEAFKCADAIQTFRFAVRSVAKRFGLYATFMPKPREDVAGSGMHTYISMHKDGKNCFRTADGKISEEGMYFLGGILKHAKGLTAVANPIVNSYKRLNSGFDAPSRVNWSTRGEKSAIKIHSHNQDVKIEVRFPDGASNPYLLIAGIIAAGLDGIENKINPGEDCHGKDFNLYEKLPGNLRDAIDELNNDELLKSTFGEEFVKVYSTLKKEEWDEYMTSVSEWELNRYLTRI